MFTDTNFTKGFLIDDEWMAGIHKVDAGFMAYILESDSGEQVGAHLYPDLSQAIHALQNLNRPWIYESTSACGGGSCSLKKTKGETSLDGHSSSDQKICEISGGGCTNCGLCSH